MSTQAIAAQKLIERIRREAPGITLYNAGDEFLSPSVFGIFHFIPPTGPGTNPVTGEFREDWDGVAVIRDRYGVSKEARELAKEQGLKPSEVQPDVLMESTQQIITQLLTKLGSRGVVMLSGNAKEDEALKKAARKDFIAYKRRVAEDAVNQYYVRTRNFAEDARNKGKLPPRMTDRETALEEWLNQYAAGNFDRKAFHCEFKCGYESDDKGKVELHQRMRHSTEAKPTPIKVDRTPGPRAPEGEAAAAGKQSKKGKRGAQPKGTQ
jgi:hypothetical protein